MKDDQKDELLKAYQIDEEFLSSKEIKQAIADRIVAELACADRNNYQYNQWGSDWSPERYPHIQNKPERQFTVGYLALSNIVAFKDESFFPVEELRNPRVQTVADDCFARNMAAFPKADIKHDDRSFLEFVFKLSAVVPPSDERFRQPEVKAALDEYLHQYFDTSRGHETVNRFQIDVENYRKAGYSSEQLRDIAENGYLQFLKDWNFHKSFDVVAKFSIDDEFLNSEPVLEARTQTLKDLIAKKAYQETAEYLASGGQPLPETVLHSDQITRLIRQLVLDQLQSDAASNYYVKKFVRQLDPVSNKDFFSSQEVKDCVAALLTPNVKAYVEGFVGSGSHGLTSIKREGNVLDGKYGGQVGEAARRLFDGTLIAESLGQKDLVNEIFGREYRQAIADSDQIKKKYQIDHLNAYKNDLSTCFNIDASVISSISADFLLSVAETGPEAREGTQSWEHPFQNFYFGTISEFKEKYQLSEAQTRAVAIKMFEFYAKHVDQLASHPVLRADVHTCRRNAEGIVTTFGLTPDETREGATALYETFRAKGEAWLHSAREVKKKYKLEVDESQIEIAAAKRLEENLLAALKKSDALLVARSLVDTIPAEFRRRPDVQRLASGHCVAALLARGPFFARDLARYFGLSGITSETILTTEPEIAEKFKQLQGKFPALAAKALTSLDVACAIFDQLGKLDLLAILERHPFLQQAAIGNEQYGNKLLFKFDKLDRLSRNNIQRLYEIKAEIQAASPDVDEDSVEFRVAVQDRLVEHRRNEEILLSQRKAGVKNDVWLNYDEERTFDLGKEGSVSFAEMIITPIKRIETSLDHYRSIVLTAIDGHQDALEKKLIPITKVEELRDKLAQVILDKERALAAGDEKKVAGIEKGIMQLESEIAKPKTISVLEQIKKSMKAFDVVKTTIFKTFDDIVQLDAESKKGVEGTTVEKRKFAVANKMKTEKAKRVLKENMALLEKRVEAFQKELPVLLASALEKDWASALAQEIDQQVVESMDHYQSDRTTLASIFSEKEEQIAGKPMRIGLWSRNPDQDLYMGNYTDCCVRIDSEYHATESPIADYLTDLGMQIIAIYDEKKNAPVAAAWCWIGVDNDDKLALVVDNIEANTEYSAAFQQQLEQELRQYVLEFAKKTGVPHVVQGQVNNDLTIAAMDSAYYKLGGYNRASGYYLEGEGKAAGGAEHDGGDGDWEEDDEDEENEPNNEGEDNDA